jgi:putative PIN family toxin of toxin-antitoxin system
MRAVFDPNVLISAVLSRTGTPAALLETWLDGAFELVVSPQLLAELTRALAYPKIAARISPEDASTYVAWLTSHAQTVADPPGLPSVQSTDPNDDYLINLAHTAKAMLVTGDSDLLVLSHRIPVSTPASFRASLT